METFPHLRALFDSNLPPFSEWATSQVIIDADRRARDAASAAHTFSELSTPDWSPHWPNHILLMHTEMSGETSILKFYFRFQYPVKPPHPARVHLTDAFLRNRANLYAHLACSYAVFLIRRHRQLDIDAEAAALAARAAVEAEAAAVEAAMFLTSLVQDDYLGAWLCLSSAEVETLGIAPEPQWGDSAQVGWPAPPPDSTPWGSVLGWGSGWGSGSGWGTVNATGPGWGSGNATAGGAAGAAAWTVGEMKSCPPRAGTISLPVVLGAKWERYFDLLTLLPASANAGTAAPCPL
ncbi:hypothetical protein C8F04DRAFT_1253701 [Mycena alexandri]|uniref:Uncharacterized protein n=1 Tax=Mycena alexandri TaxID=1745969 RepID=A0AAD6T817_9AGAR|nr:hypothetical protein C8F04DRAFT_1253701 [Mycena alexandri]